MIPTGEMDKRVQLQSPVVSKDTSGGADKTYTTYATVWARIRSLSGKEFLAAQQVDSNINYEITIRQRVDVTASHRVVEGSRVFDIRAPLSDDWDTRLMCMEHG